MRILPSTRIWKRLALGSGLVVAVSLLANAFFAWRSEHRLQAKIDALRAAGEPAMLADLAPAAIPDEENAAAVLEKIGPDLDGFDKEYRQFYSSLAGIALGKRENDDQPPTEAQLADIRALLNKYPAILPALATAALCESYGSKLNFTLPPRQFLEVLMPRATQIRTLARYVGWKTAELNAAGKRDESARLMIEMLRTARLYSQEPMLIHYLISVAVRGVAVDALNQTLRSGPVSTAVRAELEAELAKQDSSPVLPRAFRSERAYAISATIEQIGVLPVAVRWPMSGFYWNELQALDLAIASADKPWHVIRTEWDAIYSQEKRPIQIAGLKGQSLAGEALRAAFWADANRLSLARCLRILNALQEFHSKQGREAKTIEELQLPAESVIDPWSGEPLHIKMTDRGWLVYSVWLNGKDDGGRINYTDGDWGLLPSGYPHEL